jgi:hypothetical protein
LKSSADVKAELEEKLRSLKQKIGELQSQEKAKVQESSMFNSAISHDNKKLSDLRFNIQQNDRINERLKEEIENIRSSEKNSIAQFGPYMVGLCADIEKEFKRGRFKHKPLGPLGELPPAVEILCVGKAPSQIRPGKRRFHRADAVRMGFGD